MRRNNLRTFLVCIIVVVISSIAVIGYIQKSTPAEGNIYMALTFVLKIGAPI